VDERATYRSASISICLLSCLPLSSCQSPVPANYIYSHKGTLQRGALVLKTAFEIVASSVSCHGKQGRGGERKLLFLKVNRVLALDKFTFLSYRVYLLLSPKLQLRNLQPHTLRTEDNNNFIIQDEYLCLRLRILRRSNM